MLRCLERHQACVGATRVHNSCVCDLCRVRVLVKLGHPRPSVVAPPVYRGSPAGTHWGDPVSRVRPDQSANSCCACWCVVVRRTRCRVVSVESPDVTFVGFPLTHSQMKTIPQVIHPSIISVTQNDLAPCTTLVRKTIFESIRPRQNLQQVIMISDGAGACNR